MADHKWQKSMMNHGLAQCCKCFITINEAAALGIMHECDAQQEPAPMFEPMTRERLETIFETFKRDALLAGMAPADWDKTIDKVKALAVEALEMRPRPISEDQIKHMAQRFLGWKLPPDFAPDNGVYFERWSPYMEGWKRNELNCRQPTGTNLFTATQAEAMVRYLVEDPLPKVTHD